MRLTMLLLAILACCAASAQDATITHTATITSLPGVQGADFSTLLDGRVETGIAFDVGTDGEGAVSFDFGAPRIVSGIRFFQNSETYYTTRYAIEGDTTGDGEFETTLAEGAEAPVLEWIEHRWEPVEVQAIRLRSVEGVSGGRRAHPCLAEVEVIGPALPADSARAAELGHPVSAVTAVRPLRRSTALIANDTPPAVVAGTDAASRAAAEALAAGLSERVGQPVPVVGEITQAGLGDRTVFAVGNCVSNPLVARLFYNWYAQEDSLYPGPGGYTIRTVTDPYPWRGEVDVIVVGGSDEPGLTAGVERLLAQVAGGELPWMLEVQSAAKPDAAAMRAATANDPEPTFAAFLTAVQDWQRWGDDAYARRAMRALDLMVETYERDPARDVPWNEETTSGPIFAAWEAFEPCPLIADEARLDYTKAFLSLLYSIPQHTSGYANLENSKLVAWNHTTFPLLGLYFGGRYFGHYHHITACDDYLAKAHATFGAQARSWKPQEDADSYVTCTMDHVTRYCLAEGRDDWVTGGNMARYADYMIGICDSRGWAAGFGDSGYSSGPGLLQRVLPLAYLTTGDPGYRWVLEHVAPGGWEDPYRQKPSERPDRFVGLNVFPLDPQVYEYTQTTPYYNEELVPSEVPVEAAWDKISMRESWDPGAQYLLLDGFGRGKHLHYDTGAITEFVADGERWLADHDYLIRNSTEHAMLSVLRDGRGDALVPSMAALKSAADLDGWSVVRTSIPGYSGLDWDRTIVWRKGRYFVALDGVTAREPGAYDLELTWKTEDTGGERLDDGRVFVADRSATAAPSSGVITVDDPDASGGRAVDLTGSSSRLAMRVALPGGEYRLHLRGTSVDGSHDSVWVRVDGGDPIPFGLAKGGYGGEIGGGTAPQAASAITLPEGDVHLLLITLRELPPGRIDRVAFYRDDTEVLAIEAEEAEALRPDDRVPVEARRFTIKSAEQVRSRVTTHESQGIAIPLCVLHQRRAEELAAGERAQFASIFFNESRDRRGQYDLGRAESGGYLVTGDDRALIALDELRADGLLCRAQVIVIEPEHILLSGATQLTLGGAGWTSAAPANVVLDLATGTMTVADAAAEPLAIGAAERATVERLLSAEPELPASEAAAGAAAATEPRWRTQFPEPGEVRRLQSADLDGDGTPELLVAQGRWFHCLNMDGSMRWSYAADNTVLDVADVQARETPGREVALASADTKLHLLSATGELIDTYQPTAPPHSQTFGDRPWILWVVEGADVDGDGLDELLTVMDQYSFIAIDQDGTRLWEYTQVAHGALDIGFADWDGDGTDEIFVSDRYGFVHGVTLEGKRAFIGYSSIGDVQFAVAPLATDRPSVIYGSSTGDLLTRGNDGEIAWRFDNFGYAVRRIRAGDITGDGSSEVLVASDAGYLYALDAAGGELWRDRAGFAVNDAALADTDGDGRAEVLAASEDGLVRVYAGDGSVRREIATGAAAKLLCIPTPGAGAQVAVATGAGEVVAF